MLSVQSVVMQEHARYNTRNNKGNKYKKTFSCIIIKLKVKYFINDINAENNQDLLIY